MPTGSSRDDRPIQGIGGREAARILGVRSEVYVYRLVSEGVIPRVAPKHSRFALDRDVVEALSLARLRPGRPYPFWLTPGEAAALLSLSRKWVLQLAERGRLPAVEHDGRWYFRRDQVQVVANSRDAGKLLGPPELRPPS